jgi:DNA-binding GntR family transcriptional regulator
MGDAAYDLIKGRILFNHYPGGFQVLEEELAREANMSRTPLKEALLRLEAEGLIEIVPRRGIRVLPLTADDIREIYDVLRPLELTAAELIAGKADNRAEIASLQTEVDAMRTALRSNDLDAWARADERFHRVLVDSAGNNRLSIAARTLLDQSQRFRMFTLRLREKPVKSTENHAALVKALARHDVEGAVKVHTGHKAAWYRDMEQLLQRFSITQI